MSTFYRRLPKFEYVRPGSLALALSFLAEHRGSAKVMAGGTDLIPQLKKREIEAPRYVIDLKGIKGLDSLSATAKKGLEIGSLTTIAAIENSSMVRTGFFPLYEAAASMASPQVRNRGTFAGNICSAVPSADSAPALLALDAWVRLASARGERKVALDAFFEGPRRTVIAQDELLVGIVVPEMRTRSRGTYLKLSPRHSMDLAVVGVAVVATCADGVCREVRIALGAVAPTPVRAPVAEAMLRGRKITPELIDEAANNAISQCSPIDDHRASSEYRCDMVYAMTRRALRQVLLQEGDESRRPREKGPTDRDTGR
jgi:carbon-monoxide dehydrogenase medium subunit